MNIVLTGGGTGGHIYPLLALIPDLKKHFDNIYFIGSGGMECRIVPQYHIPCFTVQTVKFSRSDMLKNIKIPFALSKAVSHSKKLLEILKPDVILSKGGYAALPQVIAGAKMKVPVVCHESDLTLGLSNKIGKLFGATILTAHEETAKTNKDFMYVGLPLRDELFEISRCEAMEKLKKQGARFSGNPVLLVLGGSLGARKFNNLITENLDKLTEKYFVLHITGKQGGAAKPQKGYFAIEYASDMASCYAASDIVLSRAGATAVSEISALMKKAVFIPLSQKVSRGDQSLNAEIAKKHGAFVLSEDDLTIELLLSALNACMCAPPMRAVSPDARKKIVSVLVEKAKEHENKIKPPLLPQKSKSSTNEIKV